jgi:glycosyltransferase A (GT-A) superfamily protein (DUF2064 family)
VHQAANTHRHHESQQMKRTLVILADRTFGLTGPLPAADELQGQLVEAALKDTVAVCQGVSFGPGSPAPSWLLAYPDRREWYARIAADYWLLVPQMGTTLAQRLDNALLFLAPDPEDETLFIGLRTPQLSARDLQHAFIALGQRGACLGPTTAGGVYALGIRGRWPTGLLQQVRWDEPAAEADVRRLFRRLRVGVAVLDQMEALADVTQVRQLIGERPGIDLQATPFLEQLTRKLGLTD